MVDEAAPSARNGPRTGFMVDVLEAIDCSDRLVSALLISYANVYAFEQELKDELFG